MRSSKVWAAAVMCAAGCGGQREQVSAPLELLAPGVVDDQLVMVEGAGSRGYWLDVGRAEPEAKATQRSLPQRPILMQPRPGEQELLVLCQRPESEEEGPGGELVVLDAEGVDRSYELGTRYNRLIVSEDGQYAFLYTGTDAEQGSLFFNADDVSILDLSKSASAKDNPSQRTLSSGGEQLGKIVVSPEMELAGERRRLGVVLFQSRLSLLDLTHPGRPEWTARLAAGEGDLSVVGLDQALFSEKTGRIYVRGTQSSDVYVLQLGENEGGAEGSNDFGFSLNQLGAGQPTSDIALFEGEETELLLATTYSSSLLLIDTGSARLTTIELGTGASKIIPFVTESAGSEQVQALLLEMQQTPATFSPLSI